MKKIYFIVFIIAAFNIKVNAQSFSLANIDNLILTTAGFIPLELTADLVNNSGSQKDVKMFRKINNLAPGHSSNFCWGINCYGSGTDTSTYIESMPAAGSSLARADLNPNGIAGYSEVTYCWYDVNNPADSVCLKFVYDITTGINELTNAPSDFVSMPHPNPSDRSTVLVYHVKNHDAESKILVYNVIGSKVLEMKLDKHFFFSAGCLLLFIDFRRQGYQHQQAGCFS
jgi:hypothetical protein